jgi:hypothetical protein
VPREPWVYLARMLATYGPAFWKYLARGTQGRPNEEALLGDPEVQRYVCGWCCDMVLGWFLATAAYLPSAVRAEGGPAAKFAPLVRIAFLNAEDAERRWGLRPRIPKLRRETQADSIVVAVGPQVFDDLYSAAVDFHHAVAARLPKYAAGLVRLGGAWLEWDDVRTSWLKARLGRRRWKRLERAAAGGKAVATIPPRSPEWDRVQRARRKVVAFPLAKRGAPANIELNFFLLERQYQGCRRLVRAKNRAYRIEAGREVDGRFDSHRSGDPGEWAASAGRQVSRLGKRLGLVMRLPKCIEGTKLHELVDRLDVQGGSGPRHSAGRS